MFWGKRKHRYEGGTEMKSKSKNRSIFLAIIALCEVLSLSVRYYVPTEEDAYAAISELMSSFHIDGLDPWARTMSYPMLILGKLFVNFHDFSFMVPIAFFGLLFLHLYIDKNADASKNTKGRMIGKIVLGVLFGIVQTMGLSVHNTAGLDFCFAGTYQLLLFIICSIGYGSLFVLALCSVEQLIEKNIDKLTDSVANVNKKELILSFIIVCTVYLIWILIFLPGSVDWDSHWAVEQYLAGHPNQHFPILSTWLYVGTLLLGRTLGNDGIGVFLYVFFQMLVMGYAVCKILRLEMLFKMSRCVRVVTVCYFTLVPIWGIFVQSQIKNTLFSAVFIIFICNLTELIFVEQENKKGLWIRLGTSAVLACLLQKQGQYVVLITLLILAVYDFAKRKKKECAVILATVLVITVGFNSFVTYGLGITKQDPDNPGELYSLPSVVTAYYIRENHDNLSAEEISTIEKVYSCDVDTLAGGYLRGLSDGTKCFWNPNSTSGEKVKYFALWIKEGFSHPLIYLEGILNHSYGYYVLAPTDRIENFEKESYYDYWMSYSDHDYNISYALDSYVVRDTASSLTHFFEQNSLTGWITNQGLSTWVIIAFAIMILCRGKNKNKKELFVLFGLILYALTCIASPVNGMIRYYLPILGLMPLVWTMVIRKD